MGLFDFLFGDLLVPPVIMGAYIPDKSEINLKALENEQMKASNLETNDDSKAINAETWDNLPEEARKLLSAQGFYREGDDESDDGIVIREL
jgi:hypothetical protein